MLPFVRMRLSFIRLLSVFIMINGVVISSSDSCDESDLKSCMEELDKLTAKQDLGFAQSEDELTKTCYHLQEIMGCVNNFTHRCFDSKQKEAYVTLTAGAQGLLTDLCYPGSPFRAEYLKHAACFKSLSAEYKSCSEILLVGQELVTRTEMSHGEKLRRSCCLFDGYRHCTRTALLTKCSAEAADTGEKIVTKASGPLVQTRCSNYKFDSVQCMDASSINAPSFFLTILLLISVLNR